MRSLSLSDNLVLPGKNQSVSRLLPVKRIAHICKYASATFAIVSDFGAVDISRKEAIRMIETCEADFIHVTMSHREADGYSILLERPA